MGDLSDHFDRDEFECRCGCGFDTVDARLLEALEAVRTHFDVPIKVTSGCRCQNYNNSIVGSSSKSQHTKGRAADIVVRGIAPSVVADYAEDLGMSVGRYIDFTHIDSRTGNPARWGS